MKKQEFKRIIDTNNSDHYIWGKDCHGWHFVKTENLSVIKETMPPGTQEKQHYHEKSQQFFYILSGEACFEIEGAVYTLKQKQGISIMPCEKHKITNITDSNLEFIVISNPISHGDRINLE
ncbi:MAG TPA: cupin domain-containing protein [Bacteroidales bacterium]|nr:cupin domain-containing protein [Bacteroidales bacterium]